MTGLASLRQTLAVALSAAVLALALAGEAAAVPDITLEPVAGLAFGNVLVGNAAPGAVGVFNDGTSAGTIGAISLSGDPSFSITLDDCAGLTLQTDEFCVVDLAFAPTVAGAAAAQLSVASDAPGSPDLLALSGTGIALAPVLSADPLALDFGAVARGTSRDLPVRITNTGTAAAAIGKPTLGRSPAALRSEFAIAADGCGNTSVPPAGSCTITVRFRSLLGSGPQPSQGTLVVRANANSVTIPLSGSWAPTAAVLKLARSERLVTTRSPLTTVTVTGSRGAGGDPRLTLGGADAAAFAVDRDGCAGRNPGLSVIKCRFTIRFSGSKPGAYEATAHVANSMTAAEIPVYATGVLSKVALRAVLSKQARKAAAGWRKAGISGAVGRRGLVVDGLRLFEAGAIRVDAYVGKRKLGTGKTPFDGRGAARVRVKLGKRAKARLLGRPASKLRAVLSFRPDAGDGPFRARISTTLRR